MIILTKEQVAEKYFPDVAKEDLEEAIEKNRQGSKYHFQCDILKKAFVTVESKKTGVKNLKCIGYYVVYE